MKCLLAFERRIVPDFILYMLIEELDLDNLLGYADGMVIDVWYGNRCIRGLIFGLSYI